jgi:dTDP-4-dehydrorhamnose reductase
MPNSLRILIVGGDSFVGRALGRRHEERSDTVTYTSRRRNSTGAVPLDLRNVPADWQVPGRVDVAYLCAAVARVDECEKNPAAARAVNVDGTLSVARALLRSGAFVVLLSTNYVFSDTNPRPAPSDPVCPVTEYGRQKAAAERGLAGMPGEKAVVRLTKVLGRESPLIDRWVRALEAGGRVLAFRDVQIAPISIAFVTDALCRIGAEKHQGVHHLSGRDDVSYATIARLLAAKLGVSQDLVGAQSFRDVSAVFPSPRHGSLDMTTVSSKLRIHPQTVEDVVADLLPSG